MPRRCRLSVASFAASALAVQLGLGVVAPRPATAQALPTDSDLLRPTLEGNPNAPPTFARPANGAALPASQAPPTDRFAAPFGLSGPPVYGSPTGFGAGDTGFDSSNRSRRARQAQIQSGQVQPNQGAAIAPPNMTFQPGPPTPPQVSSRPPDLPSPPPPPEVYPSRAAARPGAVLPAPTDLPPITNPPPTVYPLAAANRPGAVLVLPAPYDFAASVLAPAPGVLPLNTVPLGVPSRALPLAAPDPYAALGIRAGSFLLFPSLDIGAGYNTNPSHVPGGAASSVYSVAPELQVASDWSRHSFTADIAASYFWYGNDSAFTPELDRPYVNAKFDGRIDVTRMTQILLENRIIVSTDNPGSPNIAANVAKLPIDTTIGGTVGLAQQLGRFNVSLRGSIDSTNYQNSTLTNGQTASNADRDYNQYGSILRVGYEIDPGLQPFVEGTADVRAYAVVPDIYGEDRDSTGVSVKVGAAFGIFGPLSGELALGYLSRDYHDPTLPNIKGPTLDGSILWQATPLTSARFSAATAVGESTQQGVSGDFSHDFNIQVDHALRTWLVATLKAGYGRDNYEGLDRIDNRYFISGGFTYKLSRELQLKSELRQDWLDSNVVGVGYAATSFIMGLRLQR